MKRFISGVATLATVLGLSAAPAAAIQVASLGPPLLAPASIPRQQSMAMKLFTMLLALQVAPTQPNPTAHI